MVAHFPWPGSNANKYWLSGRGVDQLNLPHTEKIIKLFQCLVKTSKLINYLKLKKNFKIVSSGSLLTQLQLPDARCAATWPVFESIATRLYSNCRSAGSLAWRRQTIYTAGLNLCTAGLGLCTAGLGLYTAEPVSLHCRTGYLQTSPIKMIVHCPFLQNLRIQETLLSINHLRVSAWDPGLTRRRPCLDAVYCSSSSPERRISW